MNLAGIAAKAQRGYGIAAARAGYRIAQFRPASVFSPVSGAPIGVLRGYFDRSDILAFRATAWGKPMAWAVLDASGLLVGDYLAVQSDPALPGLAAECWFVARLEPAKPPLCVLCNVVLDVLTPVPVGRGALHGYQPPGDPAAATDVLLASAWPASLLIKTRGDSPPAKLPTDTRAGFFEILMPAVPGVSIGAGLVLRDAAGARYRVQTAELSGFGVRLLASVEQA